MNLIIENSRLKFFNNVSNSDLDLEIERYYTIDNVYFQIDVIDGNTFCFDVNTIINNTSFNSIFEVISYLDSIIIVS